MENKSLIDFDNFLGGRPQLSLCHLHVEGVVSFCLVQVADAYLL